MTTAKKTSKFGSLWMKLPQPVRYGILSVSAGVIQGISFVLLYEVIFSSQSSQKSVFWICHLIALSLSVLWNFTLNRKFTFQSANNVPIAMLKVACFYLVFTPLRTWGGDWLNGIGWNEYLVLAISMITNFVCEFLYQRFVVFGASIDTAVKKQK